jgi:[acyl-carrier-protein] S-malonyltransferase
MPTAIVIAPGRGSYRKESLNSLQHPSSALDIADQVRRENQRITIRELDAKPKFSSRFHISGENASLLTAAAGFSDFERISKTYDIVAVCGNSMGHYTAMGLSGALSIYDSCQLIDKMGEYQERNQIGGQLIYPIVRDNWTMDQDKLQQVFDIVSKIPDLYISIYLGGNVVLGGTKQSLQLASEKLPNVQLGTTQFPLILPLHSAFHTPLLESTSRKALWDLQHLEIQQPTIPLIDGRGKIWRPQSSDLQQLWEYTLTHQVTKTYHFTNMIRCALRNFAPDVLICLGPGNSIGSAVAQTCIQEKWWNLSSKDDFVGLQKTQPKILSFSRPEQLSLIENPQ